MKTAILALLCVSPLTLTGGCVIVRVTDDANGAFMPGADVSCKVQPSGRTMSLGTTNDMGKLIVFPPLGIDTLTVSKPGYASFTGSYDEVRPRGNEIILDVRMVPAGSESSGFPGRKPPEFDK
jgi:hypothetical protein